MSRAPDITLEHCFLSWEAALDFVAGWRDVLPGGRIMDPKAQIVGALIKSIRPPDVMPTPAQSRAQFEKMVSLLDEPAPALVRREDMTIPGPAGSMRCRLYDASPTPDGPPRPVLLFAHGGGWVQGDLDSHDGPCARIARDSGALVLALDYRLAPEHKYPAAVEDVDAAYRWLREHARELGGDPARVAVAGDSAGGNLAAVLCQTCIADGIEPPSFQALVYPALDLAWEGGSHRDMADAYVLPRTRLEWYIEQYLDDPRQVSDPRISPLRRAPLGQQPPTLIITCGFDPLRDEGKLYADRLTASGTSVTYHEYPGQIHAFLSLARAIPQALSCQREIADYARREFAIEGGVRNA